MANENNFDFDKIDEIEKQEAESKESQLDNFGCAELLNKAYTQLNGVRRRILSYYCSLLHPLIRHRDCYTIGTYWRIIDNYGNDIEFKITEDGMVYSKNGMDYIDIPCEYDLPTANEIIEELDLERIDE